MFFFIRTTGLLASLCKFRFCFFSYCPTTHFFDYLISPRYWKQQKHVCRLHLRPPWLVFSPLNVGVCRSVEFWADIVDTQVVGCTQSSVLDRWSESKLDAEDRNAVWTDCCRDPFLRSLLFHQNSVGVWLWSLKDHRLFTVFNSNRIYLHINDALK